MPPAPSELAALEAFLQSPHATFFDNDSPITAARVLARLDVMGGIADYSGANVCQALLAPAILAAVQTRNDACLRIVANGSAAIEIRIDTLTSDHVPLDYPDLRQRLATAGLARYPLAALLTLFKEQSLPLTTGFNIVLVSSIPMNVGIASSAAVEIATLAALNAHLQLELSPLRLAQLGQLAENRIVGAPCGIMDQIAIACGKPDKLTHILCRPGEIVGEIGVPTAVRFVGVNTNIKHSVAANPYSHVRIGAFMGKKIINALRGERGSPPIQHLTELTPEGFRRDCASELPVEISGRSFLDRYQSHDDPVTTIDPAVTYRVAGPTEHPINENARVLQFIAALKNPTTDNLQLAGQLMFQSHESYRSLCRLSTPEVDTLIDALKALGPDTGLYGAKITGGGTGGTAALLATPDALARHLPPILASYAQRTGRSADVFQSPPPDAPSFLIRRFREP